MKDIIKENLDWLLTYNEIQVNKIKEIKECWSCDLLLQFIDDYKTIIQILLEDKE